MYRTHKQPVGQVTRGKTAPLRLRRLDRWVAHHCRSALRHTFVDLGYGANPTTTLEAAAAFRALAPGMQVVGLEIDPARVEAAQYAVDARTRFRRGGFDLPLLPDEPVGVLRAMNVLRQYPEDHALPNLHAMRDRLEPAGVLVEGTSNPHGNRMVVNLITPSTHRVLFSVNLRHPLESPWDLTAVLPKNLIHRMEPGTPIYALFQDWRDAWETTHPMATFGPLAHWTAAGDLLARRRTDVEQRRPWLRRGYLVWRPPSRGIHPAP